MKKSSVEVNPPKSNNFLKIFNRLRSQRGLKKLSYFSKVFCSEKMTKIGTVFGVLKMILEMTLEMTLEMILEMNLKCAVRKNFLFR